MLVTILLIVFLLIIAYLLLVPISLFINTASNQYYIQVKGLGKATIEADEKALIRINMKVFFFSYNFYPLMKEDSIKVKKDRKKITKKKRSKHISYRTFLSVLKSFKVRQFQIDIDSGDCISNSKLYPFFAFFNYYKGTRLNVNFEGRNRLLLSMENRPIDIIRAYINN